MPVISVLAQVGKGGADKKAKPALHKPAIPAYLGHSTLTGGNITKPVFDSLLRQGISAKDSLGKDWTVKSFSFIYAERNLYDDSLGTPTVMTDYSEVPCPGDTISADLAIDIYTRTKPGDTVFIDNITISKQDIETTARGMKFVLIKSR